ncbi:MAG: DUF2254 domain-containing protein [Gemmatimonadetes bacterium]|nr:DUF2254 domain-containing protein [Gemmatimonadota bacterium]
MKVLLLRVLDSIRTSYWFLPTIMAAASLLLSWWMVSLDRSGFDWIDGIGFVYSGGPEGARAVLSTIASSMITVAGVVFSITIVALSLASQQFGPRLLYSFMRDRGNQFVLGTFIATFLYCLLTLRTIYGEGEDRDIFVPHLATTVGVLLAAMSLGVLIYFIHHVSIAIQAPQVIASVTAELHHGISALRGHFAGRDADEREVEEIEKELRGLLLEDVTDICTKEDGYIQAINQIRLMDLACEHDLLIRLPSRQGLYLHRGEPLAMAAPSLRVTPEIRDEIADAVVIGSRRTAIHDIEFSIDQLAEVAVRALSAGINDPYTAADCVDHLGSGLLHVMKERLPSPYRMDEHGRPRIIMDRPLTFAGVVDTSLSQIRQHVGGSVSVTMRMLENIASLIPFVEDDEHLAVLKHHAIMIHRQGKNSFTEEWDRSEVDERFDEVVARIERRALLTSFGDA